ncbi:PREDICTED: uncharacterized protein LOC108558939 [Nicrophorus vespilloides]|uniref:Uncharacterized protein LOC108558939 n=1 Tax=Nicrophorus vespilloides TaxID=110193 RepID=A0ABM1MAC1_NICVS|nr:PREDICTED: uncharacterized protein LOC108558939 [Nicrophorus vespilloides]
MSNKQDTISKPEKSLPPPPKCTPGWNDPPPLGTAMLTPSKPKLTQRKFVSSIFSPTDSSLPVSPSDPKLEELMASLHKILLNSGEDMEKIIADVPRQWKQPYCDENLKEKTLQICRHLSNKNYQDAHDVINTFNGTQLWFTLFFRNVITKITDIQ